MVKAGTADLPNVTVLPTGPYLISSATFPTYFLKDKANVSAIHCSLDVEIFLKHFVPRFGINCRYVGTEPLSPVTNAYNQVLKDLLPPAGVELREFARRELDDAPISASRVRALLRDGRLDELRALVPETTWNYLQNHGLLTGKEPL